MPKPNVYQKRLRVFFWLSTNSIINAMPGAIEKKGSAT